MIDAPTTHPTEGASPARRRLARRSRAVIGVSAVATVVVLAAAACTSTSTTEAGGRGTTAPTTAPPPGTDAGPTPAGRTDPLTPSEAAYPSAVTDEVVADPAFAPLGRDISRRIEQASLPGASLLVLHDGELVHQQAYGGYDLSTVVPIASASKWLSGATIMTLVDDGLIDLDAPIRTYLPEATGPSGAITMRQLVAFTSGLEYDDRIPCMSDLSKTLAQCNTEILALPLIGRPGTGYRYTSTHLQVAAGVAEAVTGQTWEEIFQERIARPLGMADTSFTTRTATAPGAAADGHPIPAGSAWSSLGDYGRFLEMLVHDGVAPDGTRILSSDAIEVMRHDQTGDARFVSAAANRKRAETPYGVAHWLDIVDDQGEALVESSPGKFGFRPWIDHVNGIAGVYLVVDRDDQRVADSPDHEKGVEPTVQTSGNFVVVGSAKALGGELPDADR